MRWAVRRHGKGFVLIEILAVMAIVAVLLGLGYSVYKGARLSARVAIAENNLKQISTALELYFRKYGTYPPEGVDLAYVLKPFVQNPDVFKNPLMEEEQPGQTISDLYVEPTISDIDRPGVYITAMPSDNGSTIVVLETGGKVERRDDLSFNPNDTEGIISLLTERGTQPPADTGGTTPPPDSGGGSTPPPDSGGGSNPPPSGGGSTPPPPPPGSTDANGEVNLNPNNKDDFEFEMDGFDVDGKPLKITRDTLHESNGKFTYQGTAARIRFRPKGNGNQNGIVLNGKPYRIYNSTTYLILVLKDPATGQLYKIDVKIYNRKEKGNAMGQWWMVLKTPPYSVQLYIVEPGPSGSGEVLRLVMPD